MHMNIALVYPRPNEHKYPRFGFSYDWAVIATALHKQNNNVFLYDFSVQYYDRVSFLDFLISKAIQLVVIEFDSFTLKRSENFIHGYEIIDAIRSKCGKLPVIVYGHYPCIVKEPIKNADRTVNMGGLSYFSNCINEYLPPANQIHLDSINEYPFIDRTYINEQIPFYAKNNKSSLIRTSLGCGNSCIFCQRKSWCQHYTELPDRYVYDEFQLLAAQNILNLWIVDDNFTFHLGRAKRILKGLIDRGYTKDMKISLSSWVNVDEEFLELAHKANVKVISFGIESANYEILNFYKKNIDLQHAKDIIRHTDECGIFTIGNFIIGAPNETMDTISKTFSFIEECGFDQLNIKILSYLAGAKLFDYLPESLKNSTRVYACKENGLTNFSLTELEHIKNDFIEAYRKFRYSKLQDKIKKFGTPYD